MNVPLEMKHHLSVKKNDQPAAVTLRVRDIVKGNCPIYLSQGVRPGVPCNVGASPIKKTTRKHSLIDIFL